jgi:diguanylate cyclase (GGDEF)-like protein/PAS domain S-box-containing protein
MRVECRFGMERQHHTRRRADLPAKRFPQWVQVLHHLAAMFLDVTHWLAQGVSNPQQGRFGSLVRFGRPGTRRPTCWSGWKDSDLRPAQQCGTARQASLECSDRRMQIFEIEQRDARVDGADVHRAMVQMFQNVAKLEYSFQSRKITFSNLDGMPIILSVGSYPEDIFRSLVEATSDFVGTVDREGRFVYLNPAGRRLLQIPEDEDITGQSVLPYNDLPNNEDQRAAARLATEKHSTAAVAAFVNRSGQRIPVLQTFIVHQTESGTWYSTIARDISARIAEETSLREQADQDPLTGLLNRTAFRREAAARAARLQSADTQSGTAKRLELTMLDLDRFKQVNDTRGHDVGDRLLCGVADRLRQVSDALVGRLGGDEFVFIGKRGDFDGLVKDLEDYLSSFGAGLSFGSVPFGANVDLSRALQEADERLYEAKRGGLTRDEGLTFRSNLLPADQGA